MIQLENLTKTYDSDNVVVEALKDVNLTIEDGEIFGIIGLSGAGKSTLIRCINLLEKPTSGKVIIDGQDLMALTEKELLKIRSNIGMIFQNFNLLDQRTVLANVCFPLEILKYKKEDAVKRARELLQIVGLADREGSYPSQLSGGQKQRVAIARALASSPKYLLCDEATSALDPNTTTQILSLLKEINQKLNVTVIVITHEMRVVESICSKVAVIDRSQIVECGDVGEVFTNPKSQIAKQLISPNLLKWEETLKQTTSKILRLVFNGEISNRPVVSALSRECGVDINILFADMKEIDGKSYGHMVIEIPAVDGLYKKVTDYLVDKNVNFTEGNKEDN